MSLTYKYTQAYDAWQKKRQEAMDLTDVNPYSLKFLKLMHHHLQSMLWKESHALHKESLELERQLGILEDGQTK